MNEEIEKGPTAHMLKATALGVTPNTLAAIQRTKAVPSDIAAFSADDDDFVRQLSVVLGDEVLLRLQLNRKHQKGAREKSALVASAADFEQYKKWEHWVLQTFTSAFLSDEPIDTEEVLFQLQDRFRYRSTRPIRERVQQLRHIAWARAKRKKERR